MPVILPAAPRRSTVFREPGLSMTGRDEPAPDDASAAYVRTIAAKGVVTPTDAGTGMRRIPRAASSANAVVQTVVRLSRHAHQKGKDARHSFKEEDMGLRINTNVASLNTIRHLYNTTVRYHKSLEKLSSGLRINRAGDDAAGLAISERLKSDIRALNQAARNAGDGISLVQTAEGALDEVHNIMLRLRELAEQSMNGTLSDTERGYLDAEYQDLLLEITRIADTTTFGGVNLLNSGLPIAIQVGIGTTPQDQVVVNLPVGMDAIGLGLLSGIGTAADAANAMDEIILAVDTVAAARGDFGAMQSRLESAIRNINNIVENLSAANSRIRDVDIASETATMTSLRIMQEAGVAVLAQANLSASLALALLQ